MLLEPSLPLSDVMYFIPCAPLICCSSGMVTADSTVCALAPVYPLDTETCGGARSGNCETGRVGITAAPARMMSRAHTVAKTGRRMKKSTNIKTSNFELPLRRYRRSIHQKLGPGNDHFVARLDA